MGPGFFIHYNFKRETAQDIFSKTHKKLIKDARKWLISTSQSCSVVAALIATVGYTSATTVPGGYDGKSGFPVVESQPPFQVFAKSSFIALCFSVTSLILFLAILTSRFHESHFKKRLPLMLISGMLALFASIIANLVSFCAGHFYNIHNNHESGLPLYSFLIFPAAALPFASSFHLYADIIKVLSSREPERSKEIKVEIDSSEPLKPKVLIKGKNRTFWQPFISENLPVVCCSCGWIGHNEGICSYSPTDGALRSENVVEANPTGCDAKAVRQGGGFGGSASSLARTLGCDLPALAT
ncbi:uncharacterized protein [Elaeis guineensis]|uniref:uncharacterized protein n=1 Tax=Elaeis guineensis var. tenera TaxID=51953 RepID=UPI003C6CC8A7